MNLVLIKAYLSLIIQMLMDWNVLKMVLVLLLAAEGQLGALVQLISVALTRYVHHNEVLTELVLIRVIHSD